MFKKNLPAYPQTNGGLLCFSSFKYILYLGKYLMYRQVCLSFDTTTKCFSNLIDLDEKDFYPNSRNIS